MVIELPVPPEGLYDDIPAGFWVALSMDEQTLLASAATLDELSGEMDRLGITDYVTDKVLPRDTVLVF